MCNPTSTEPTEPFLRWAGGKRWLAPALVAVGARSQSSRLFEPFLGGGAFFFALRPSVAVLSDTNAELINTYTALRDGPEQLIEKLALLATSPDVYYALRDANPKTPVDRAVRFLYLNRTAFNGLWRVNQRGSFNVPYGCKPGTVLCDADRIRACSQALTGTQIVTKDFREILATPIAGDLVYLDPPYTTSHNDNGFKRYNEKLFSWSDQQALAEIATDLSERGVAVIATNACHNALNSLYARDSFVACAVSRTSRMAARNEYRMRTEEAVLVSRTLARTPIELRRKLERSGIPARTLRLG